MSVTLQLTPGKVFQAGELVTTAKLNQLGTPVLQIEGSFGPTDMASGDYSGILAAGPYFYGVDTGGPNAAAITLNPAPAAYVDGMVVFFKCENANTGATSLNVNGLGAATIKKQCNVDLQAGDLVPGQMVLVEYQLDASIVPAGADYSGAGAYVLPVIQGRIYTWTKGNNDTSLVNGIQTLVATGPFTATGATVTLNGADSVGITCLVTPQSNVWQMLSEPGQANTQQNYPFVGASAYLAGSQGLVPFPKAGQQNFYLRGDGTWQDAVGAAVAAAISGSVSINEIFKQQNFI